MNILQILPELNVGGVETGTLDLARQLVKLGHKAVVVSAGGEMVKALQASGAVHYTLPVEKKSPFTVLAVVPRLVEVIRKEKIDIVHARSRVPAWIAYLACRRTQAVFVTTCHGYYQNHPLSYAMGWAKRVIVLSNVIARHMIEDFAVPYSRIRLIPRSVNTDKFVYRPARQNHKGEFNIGIIGRITPIKGHLDFIKAMARAARHIPGLKIWIVGSSPASKQGYKEELEILVRRLGLWDKTQFLGVQRDIPEVLSHLDALVLATTTHEAFGRVIIEAQACGVAVVATRVGGVIDIIEDEQTGLLVAPRDPASMADAVIRLAKDYPLRGLISQRAYLKIKEKYTLERMVESTINVYKEALAGKNILLIKFSSLGDIVLSTAALRSIRQKFGQGYKITFLTGSESKEALLRSPYIDELLVCDFKSRDKGFAGILKAARILRKRDFDIVVDLQNNRKSHLLSFLSMSPARYGYANGKWSFLLNHRVKLAKGILLAPVEHQFRILQMLGIELYEPAVKTMHQLSGKVPKVSLRANEESEAIVSSEIASSPEPALTLSVAKGNVAPRNDTYTDRMRLELWPGDEDKRYVEDFLLSQWLGENQKIAGVNISASLRWQTKSWPLSHLAQLCEELAKRDIRVVVTGTQDDAAAAHSLINMVKAKPINACGKTNVNQLAALIQKCSVYISADSASLHIASAMGVAIVGLFGPTDPRRHLPPAQRCIVLRKELPCSPCYKPQCRNKRCMQLISPSEVLEAVLELLNK